MKTELMYTNLLVLGNTELLNLFRFLKHFHMNIDFLDEYNKSDYELIITTSKYFSQLSNYEGLIFNIIAEPDNFITNKNVVNLFLNFDFEKDLINQFINNKLWVFYYKSVEKQYVKFIYDLFNICSQYNKIQFRDVKFHKI